jgi:flagellar hook assembly protein FlgD
VPWVPGDGNADNGKPYAAGDPSSGIIFDNLTQSVKIEIYTLAGELVWSRTTDTSSGKIQWDARNDAGREAASGGYFAVITDPATGARVVRKLAIVR